MKEMVKKATEKKPAEKKQESSIETLDKSGNRFMIILAVAVAVVIAIVIFVIASTGGEEQGTIVKSTDVETSEFDNVINKALESFSSTDKAILTAEIDMRMSGQSAAGLDMDVGMDVRMEYDAPNERMAMISTTATSGGQYEVGDQTSESYVIGSDLYSLIVDPYTNGTYWIKQESTDDMWAMMRQGFDMGDSLDFVEGDIVGEETKNGKKAYKLSAKPDMNKVVRTLMEMQLGDLGALGVSQGDVDAAIDMLVGSIDEAEFLVWVEKDTYNLLSGEGTLRVDLNLDEMYGTPGLGSLVMGIEISFDIDYDTAFTVELPPGALDAMTMEEYYSLTYGRVTCGDGWCDIGENSTSCPTDCYCGDYLCDETEDEESCPEDCASFCGDYWCDDEEDEATCPEDCEVLELCGNFTRDENTFEVCSTCGDGICDEFEECVPSIIQGEMATMDCGSLYCPMDCEDKT